jgi:hypothetical protein
MNDQPDPQGAPLDITPSNRNYPLDAPFEGETDPRLTMGLIFDIAHLLTSAGYPPPRGLDIIELHQAIDRFLYKTKSPVQVLEEIARAVDADKHRKEPGE